MRAKTWTSCVISMSFGLTAELALSAVATGGLIDLEMTTMQNMRQVTGHPTRGSIIGVTFDTTATNRGDPIPWGFPVRELTTGDRNAVGPDEFSTAETPWADIYGYSAGEGRHNAALTTALSTSSAIDVGRHPHIQLFLFCLPGSSEFDPDRLIMIGNSELKHTFRTFDDRHHYLGEDHLDTYFDFLNEDQGFFGPIDEIDPETFLVEDHFHLGDQDHPDFVVRGISGTGNDYDGAGKLPYNVYDRRHGRLQEPDLLEHLLMVDTGNLDRLRAPPETTWWVATSYFVFGDGNLSNNTLYMQFNPDILLAGGPDAIIQGTETRGRFLGPIEQEIAPPGACVPEPSSLVLTAIGMTALGAAAFKSQRRNGCRRAGRDAVTK